LQRVSSPPTNKAILGIDSITKRLNLRCQIRIFEEVRACYKNISSRLGTRCNSIIIYTTINFNIVMLSMPKIALFVGGELEWFTTDFDYFVGVDRACLTEILNQSLRQPNQ